MKVGMSYFMAQQQTGQIWPQLMFQLSNNAFSDLKKDGNIFLIGKKQNNDVISTLYIEERLITQNKNRQIFGIGIEIRFVLQKEMEGMFAQTSKKFVRFSCLGDKEIIDTYSSGDFTWSQLIDVKKTQETRYHGYQLVEELIQTFLQLS